MEVFEIKKTSLHRQPSTGPPQGNTRMPYLLTIIGIILVTSAALLILHFLIGYKNLNQRRILTQQSIAEKLQSVQCDEKYCDSKGCVSMAARMMEVMDPEADPCMDFYEFACGGYSKSKGLPYARRSLSPVNEARDNILVDIRTFMESPSNGSENQTTRKLRQFYNSCINTARRDEHQNQALLNWLSEIGLYLDDAHSDAEGSLSGSWRNLAARLEEYQIHTIINPSFKGSADIPIEIIEIDCTIPLLEPNVYLNPSSAENEYTLSLYKEIIDGALEQLPMMDANRKRQFVDNILGMETDISRAIQRSESIDAPSLSTEHVQQLKEFWRSMIGDSIQEVEVVSSCKYNLETVLSTLDNVLTNMSFDYVAWRMLLQLMPYLGSEYRSLRLHFMSQLPGWDYAYDSTWRECSDLVRTEMGLGAFKALLDSGYISAEHIQAFKENFREVKRNFLLTFRSIDWASALIRKLFLSKVKNMKLKLGYPEFIIQPEVLDTIFKDLELDDDFFQNVLNLKKFKTRHFFNRLWYGNPDNPISEVSLDDNPLDGSSKYDYTTNTVHIDFVLLHPPVSLWTEDVPKYLKFGEISLLAKEMSHAFDTTGCFYDGKGKRWERSWWPETLSTKFDFYTDCLHTQLQNSTYADLNSSKTLDSFIADIGSFLALYGGLVAHVETFKNEKQLPGVSLTKKQTYYVRIAQSYCKLGKFSPKEEKYSIESPRFRVNNAVSNMDDFGNVFNCPPKSVLNPEVKCNLL